MALLLMMIKTFIKQHTEPKRQKNRSSRDVLNVRHNISIVVFLRLEFLCCRRGLKHPFEHIWHWIT